MSEYCNLELIAPDLGCAPCRQITTCKYAVLGPGRHSEQSTVRGIPKLLTGPLAPWPATLALSWQRSARHWQFALGSCSDSSSASFYHDPARWARKIFRSKNRWNTNRATSKKSITLMFTCSAPRRLVTAKWSDWGGGGGWCYGVVTLSGHVMLLAQCAFTVLCYRWYQYHPSVCTLQLLLGGEVVLCWCTSRSAPISCRLLEALPQQQQES